MKPHVLFVQELLPTYRSQLCELLGRRGALRLTVAASSKGRSDGFDVADSSLHYERVALPLSGLRIPALGRFVWLVGLTTFARQIRPDVVITTGAKNFVQSLWLLLRRPLGSKIIVFMHAEAYGDSLPRRLLHRFYRDVLYRWLADGLLVYTEAEWSSLVGRSWPRHRVWYGNNTIDTASVRIHRETMDAAEIQAIKARYGVTDGPTVAFMGRLVAGKMPSVLRDFLQELRRLVPTTQLVVVGDGPSRSSLQELFAGTPGVTFTGALYDDRTLSALLSSSRGVFVPGYLGLVVNHAFALGLPLFCFASKHHKPEFSYVEDGRNGLVFPEGDVAAAARGVAAVMTDDSLFWRLREGAERSAAHLTLEAMARHWEQAVTDVLAVGTTSNNL